MGQRAFYSLECSFICSTVFFSVLYSFFPHFYRVLFSFFQHLHFDLLYLCFDSFAVCPPVRKWLELIIISIRKLGFVISYCTFNLLSIKGSPPCDTEIRVGQDGTS